MNNNDLLKAVALYVIAEGAEKESAKKMVEKILGARTPNPQTRERTDVENTIRRMLAEVVRNGL